MANHDRPTLKPGPRSVRSSGSNTNTHLATLETRVTGLENGVNAIVDQLTLLGEKLDQRGQTPWNILIGIGGLAFTVIAGIGWLAYAPVVATQLRLETMDREHYRELRDEIARVDKDTPNRTEYDRGRAVNDRNLERLERRLDRIEYGKGS